MVGQNRQTFGNGDFAKNGRLVVGSFFRRVDNSEGNKPLAGRAVVKPFHSGKLHGLLFGNLHSGAVAGPYGKHDACQPDPRRYLYGILGKPDIAFLKEEPAADTDHERRAEHPPGKNGVEKLVDSHRRKGHVGK